MEDPTLLGFLYSSLKKKPTSILIIVCISDEILATTWYEKIWNLKLGGKNLISRVASTKNEEADEPSFPKL